MNSTTDYHGGAGEDDPRLLRALGEVVEGRPQHLRAAGPGEVSDVQAEFHTSCSFIHERGAGGRPHANPSRPLPPPGSAGPAGAAGAVKEERLAY